MLKGKSGFKPRVKPSGGRRPVPSSRPHSVASPAADTPVSTTTASTPSVVDSQEQSQPEQPPPPPPSSAVIQADSPVPNTNSTVTVAEPPSKKNTQAEPVVISPPVAVPTAFSALVAVATQEAAATVDGEPAPQTLTPTSQTPPQIARKPASPRKSKVVPKPILKRRPNGRPTILPTPADTQEASVASSEPREPPAILGEPVVTQLPSNESAPPPEQQVSENVSPSIETPSPEVRANPEESVEPSSSTPSTAPKPKRGRKRGAVAATGEVSTEPIASAPPKKRVRKRAALLPGEEGYEETRAAAPKATRPRKRTRATTENAEAETEGEGEGDGDGAEPNGTGKSRRAPRGQREATPENAENLQVDVNEVKMADLAKDMHIGKKFSLHDELMARERAKRLKYNEKRKKARAGNNEEEEEEEDHVAEGDEATRATSAGPTQVAAPVGEQYHIINGEIVLDMDSLAVDRHARAREAEGHFVVVEENDFTHHTTSQTYLRRALKPGQWSDEDTEQFYWALSRFGTDFETISRMFPDKTRKHVKLKFNREERANPARINAALVGQKTEPMSIEEYKQRTKQEYEPAQAIYDEHERREKEFEERQKKAEEEKAEEARKKNEEILAQLNSNLDANGKKRRGGRKRVVEASL